MTQEAKNEVELTLGGQRFGGWEEVSIETSLETLSGSFSLSAAARGDGKDADFQFKAGEECRVSIDGETVITGWIDTVEPSFDGESHMITIGGRDKAADLIDCSAVHKPGSWTNTALETIAADLAKPFAIGVTAKASTAPAIKKFSLQQGETVHAAIERLLRFRGLIAVSTSDGNVEIITPASGAAARQLSSQAMLSAQARHDVSQRFSEYIVKGQSSGDDRTFGKSASQVKSQAKDPAVKRYRPLLVVAEDQATAANLKTRAEWEASTRAGKAQSAEITVRGWRDADGKLWARNSLLHVAHPWLFIEHAMLVTGVKLAKGAGGTVTTLSVSPPEAWTQQKVPEGREAGRVKS